LGVSLYFSSRARRRLRTCGVGARREQCEMVTRVRVCNTAHLGLVLGHVDGRVQSRVQVGVVVVGEDGGVGSLRLSIEQRSCGEHSADPAQHARTSRYS